MATAGRQYDPMRPQIPVDLDILQTAEPEGWQFYEQILKLREHAIPSSVTQKWASNLRFLTRDSQRHGAAFRVVERPRSHDYVAISWCWDTRDSSGENIKIMQLDRLLRNNIAPKDILSRAAWYADAHGLKLLWIDKECMMQNDRNDKEQGVQPMDLVYQRSRRPLGILSCEKIEEQSEIDALTAMIRNKTLDLTEWRSLHRVMKRIAENKFFKRAWICQEAISSGGMTIIIPCKLSLNRTEPVGRTPGEIEIRLDGSQWGVENWTMLAAIMKGQDPCPEGLEFNEWEDLVKAYDRLSMYTVSRQRWNPSTIDSGDRFVRDTIENCNLDWRHTASAQWGLDLLEDKENSVSSERLAILANICNYQMKLNTSALAHFTFAQCVLALTIMNNDMSFFDPISCQAIEEFVSRQVLQADTSDIHIEHSILNLAD